jgi:formate dehydrogenase subunit delta
MSAEHTTQNHGHDHGKGYFDDEEHISTTADERLVIMANQIAKFFASQKHDRAVAGCSEHIAKFWDPRMRSRIRAHLADGGKGLDPLAREAVQALQR